MGVDDFAALSSIVAWGGGGGGGVCPGVTHGTGFEFQPFGQTSNLASTLCRLHSASHTIEMLETLSPGAQRYGVNASISLFAQLY